tara:strand:- start:22 stop:432 length:411 start_codon:yes stop_codon:yes gene_type:complete
MRFFFILLLVITSCNRQAKESSPKKAMSAALLEDPYHCEVQCLTLEYLSYTSYAEAISTCRLTIFDRDFIIENINYPGLWRRLPSFFTEEELNNNTCVRETTWESIDGEYITVWYKQKDNIWCPFDSYKYSKSTKF